MATATFLQLKTWFAYAIGESSATSVDSVGEGLINDAHKEMSSRVTFQCNKKDASLSIVANVASVPSDFDYAHIGEIKLYSYSDTTKTPYHPVPFDDVSQYSTGSYVYAVDFENGQIKTNQTTATLTLVYFAIPAVMDEDADTTNFPVPKAITFQAAGDYWEDVEEESDRALPKYQRAEALFNQAVSRNKIGLAPRPLKSKYDDDEFLTTESILATQR